MVYVGMDVHQSSTTFCFFDPEDGNGGRYRMYTRPTCGESFRKRKRQADDEDQRSKFKVRRRIRRKRTILIFELRFRPSARAWGSDELAPTPHTLNCPRLWYGSSCPLHRSFVVSGFAQFRA